MESMEIFKKVRELGEMIQQSEEMKKMKDAEAIQEEDETAREELKKFNMNRMNLARDMQSGKLSREDAVAKNNEAFDELCANAPAVKNYIEAKKVFDSMVEQINQILNYYITGTDPACTHNCSTCGGCH
jgi:cell fate (sporulation/competence/biofilm development) regulator YlbF (YheA/YmcA/DUF963 family)